MMNNVRWLADKDIILEMAIRCVRFVGDAYSPPTNVFQHAPRIKAFALHVDLDAMLAYQHGRLDWQYVLGGLPNLENIILAFSIPDRGSECIPGTDPLT